MTEPLRFGLVGCGVIGPIHAEAIATLPDAVLAAAADLVPEGVQKLTEQCGGTPYTDLARMLRHERLDELMVCTPSGVHEALACQIMRSGRHEIVEKPVAITR